MRLTRRVLHRTLLSRQHLLARRTASVRDECAHLLGLQAQETRSPFLSLAARLDGLDPHDLDRGLADHTLVRMHAMRGTIHLLDADDAGLRLFAAPVIERAHRGSPRPELARPMVQEPPRGTWRGGGGVVWADAAAWLGRPVVAPPVEDVVARYLRAFGPASAADMTTWSGVTRLGPVLAAMASRGLLLRHEDESGRALYDVPDGELADPDEPAPVRLLGTYDNLWLSHAARDRVTTPEQRAAWTGPNGGIGPTLFVDGMLAGLWRPVDGRVEVVRELRRLTASERAGLRDEVDRVEALLAVP